MRDATAADRSLTYDTLSLNSNDRRWSSPLSADRLMTPLTVFSGWRGFCWSLVVLIHYPLGMKFGWRMTCGAGPPHGYLRFLSSINVKHREHRSLARGRKRARAIASPTNAG
jgi:hypothetical protein